MSLSSGLACRATVSHWYIYSETSIYRSWIIRFPRSVVQFLWSLSESYFNYGSRIYCFPGSIVSFSDPRRKRWIGVSLYISQSCIVTPTSTLMMETEHLRNVEFDVSYCPVVIYWALLDLLVMWWHCVWQRKRDIMSDALTVLFIFKINLPDCKCSYDGIASTSKQIYIYICIN
jgi:hypothetical protein